MKTIFATLALLATLVPATSQALVQEEAICQTSDNALQVTVVNNEGTGFDRSATLTANVVDAQGNLVAAIPVQPLTGISSASFGRQTYVDIATQGQMLVMQGPSTNFRNYIIHMATNLRTENDQNMSCSEFFGMAQQ